MTTLRSLVLFTITILQLSQLSWADTPSTFAGRIELTPQAGHQNPIRGDLGYVFDGVALSKITLHTDAPIFGRSDFASPEFWGQLVPAHDPSPRQMVTAFKLQGPPHRWYFVFFGASADGITYTGAYFKAPATLDDIKKVLSKTPIILPADWKAVGTGIEKLQ